MRTILKSERTEEGKQERRRLGDTGGVSFRTRTSAPREDGVSNAITSVQKDNLLMEIYDLTTKPKNKKETTK